MSAKRKDMERAGADGHFTERTHGADGRSDGSSLAGTERASGAGGRLRRRRRDRGSLGAALFALVLLTANLAAICLGLWVHIGGREAWGPLASIALVVGPLALPVVLRMVAEQDRTCRRSRRRR